MRSKSLTSLLMRIRPMEGPPPIFTFFFFFFFGKIHPIVSKCLRRHYRSSIMYSQQEFRKSKNSMRFFFSSKRGIILWMAASIVFIKISFFLNLLINSERNENLFSYFYCEMKQQCFPC